MTGTDTCALAVYSRPTGSYWITSLSVCHSEDYRKMDCYDWQANQERVAIKSIERKQDFIVWFDFLLATPNWSEFEINQYTPKFAGCLSVHADGSDEKIIKCSRKCTITIPNKGLAIIFRILKSKMNIPIKSEKIISMRRPTHWYKWDQKKRIRTVVRPIVMVISTRSCSHIVAGSSNLNGPLENGLHRSYNS